MDLINHPFCSQISCLKFISEPQDIQQYFLVGSHLEPNNSLTLMAYGGDYSEPTIISKVYTKDVMDIQYNKNHERILTSTSNGSLNIFQLECEGESMKLKLDVGWDKVSNSAISGCLFSDNRIIAVSEDGTMLSIRLDSTISGPNDIFEFIVKDCTSIMALEQIDQNSFLTVNGFGQIKLWDTRTHCRSPEWSNFRFGSLATIHCLSRHPTQPNIVVSGSSGFIYLWDLRNSDKSGPVQLNTGPEDSNIWKLRFHPTNPQNLLIASSLNGLINVCGRTTHFDWADYDTCLSTLQMNPLIGNRTMTSLDVSENLVISGSDDEILCLVPINF